MSQDEEEMSFTEFCSETDGESESQCFMVLSAEDVVDLMKNETEKVREIIIVSILAILLMIIVTSSLIFQLPPAQLRMLLTTHKWDIVSFLEKFYDGAIEVPKKEGSSSIVSVVHQANKENKGRQLRKCPATTNTEGKAPLSRRTRNKTGKAQKECDICAESCDITLMCELVCGHFFCSVCLKMYTETAVTQGTLIDCIKCPAYACNMPINDDFIGELLSKKLKPRYQQLITSGFVSNNRLIKWCPSPDCSRAVKVDVGAPDQPAVRCHCGFQFCFACKEETHNLIPCSTVKEFKEVKAASLSTANWVVRFTKQCSKCHIDIEKNGGCNHITCSQCLHEFCWICCADWHRHGDRNCVPLEAAAFSKTNLRRLANYDTKLQIMRQSIKLDQAMYKSKLDQQLEDVKDQWFKIDFMVEAVDLLLSCRRTLADSYFFFYFYEIPNKHLAREPFNAPHKVQWLLFARNHAELSVATENLSQKLETIVDGDNFHEMKREVKGLTNTCKGLHRVVTMQVAEGFENKHWLKRSDSF